MTFDAKLIQAAIEIPKVRERFKAEFDDRFEELLELFTECIETRFANVPELDNEQLYLLTTGFLLAVFDKADGHLQERLATAELN